MTGTGQGLGGRLCSVASYDGLSQNYIDPTAEFTDDETFQTTDYTQSVPLNEYDGTSINGSNPFSSSESYPNSSPSNVFSPDPATSDSRTEDFPSERRHHASLFSNAIEQPSSETVTTVHGPGSTDLSPQWLQDRPWSEWDGENGQETGIQSTGLFNPLLYPSTATLTAVEQIPVTRPEAVPTLDINGSSPAFNNIGFWTATTGFTGTNPVLQPRTGRNNFVPKRFETSGDWRKHEKKRTRPHSCDKCGMRFLYPKDVSRHKLKHTGEKPHACPKCGTRFPRADNCRRHAVICQRDMGLGDGND